jgi:hypothetical protein
MIVPAVTEVCLPHAAHSNVHGFASSFQPFLASQHGQMKPSGQCRRWSQSAQALSSGKLVMNCWSDGGRSCLQRLICELVAILFF